MHSFIGCDPVHLLRQCKRINTVKKFEQRKRVTNFVLLQMTNEMPPQVRWKFRNLSARLLHAAFAEQRVPRFNGFAHFLRRVRLGNRDEFDFIDSAASFRCSVRDLFAHAFEVFRNRAHAQL